MHRDVKPDNLFLIEVGGETFVKVLDFGIAKIVGAPSPNRTQNGFFLGTPYYCSPEQALGGEVDARSDVYSLGATAFEMLTGAPPFVGETLEVLTAKATGEAPVLSALPPSIAATIGAMLANDRDARAPSMAWVLEAIEGWPELTAASGSGPVVGDSGALRARPVAARATPVSGVIRPCVAISAPLGDLIAPPYDVITDADLGPPSSVISPKYSPAPKVV